ncbi:MAG: c-type cytochrome [Burkholderiaceae bacterium]
MFESGWRAVRGAFGRGTGTQRRLMGCLVGSALALLLVMDVFAPAHASEPGVATAISRQAVIGLGVPVSRDEWAPYDITVFPDGRGLPPGGGSVDQGRKLYAEQCAACHGVNAIEGPAARLVGSDGFIGWDDPVRPLRIRKYPLLVQSVGARWPYATTLFDYIRRAMPYGAPKSLTSDETYALTAFLLYRHGVVNQGAIMNAGSLPKVIMPGLANSAMGD